MYVFIFKSFLHAAAVANRSITASVFQIGEFAASQDIRGISPPCGFPLPFTVNTRCSMCNVNVLNRISCFCLIIFFLGGLMMALATMATPDSAPALYTIAGAVGEARITNRCVTNGKERPHI